MFQHNSQKAEDLKTYLVIWVAIFTVLFAAYSTAVALPFAYHDDYYFFAYDDRGSYEYHPQALFFLLVGREGYYPLAFLMAKIIHAVEDLSQVRLLFIGMLALSGTVMTKFLARCGVSIWQGTALAISILLLAGFQVGVLWVTMVPFVAALLLSFAGGWLALKVGEKLADGPARFSLRALPSLGLSLALALVATFIYQPWAMFYLLPVSAYLIFTPLGAVRRTVMVLASVGLSFSLAITVYFMLHRYVFLPYFFSRFPGSRESYEANPMFAFRITSDLREKLNFFFHDVLLHATNLWNIYLSGALELVVLLVILAGAVAGFFGIRKHVEQGKRLREAGFRALILVGLSMGMVLPVVVASGGHSGFRVVVPLSALLVLMLGAAAAKIGRFLGERFMRADLVGGVVMACMCVAAAVLAWGNVRDSALNASQEFLTVKSSLRDYLAAKTNTNEVRFVLASPEFSTALDKPVAGVGEFNINSTAFWQDVPWIIRAALLDLGVAPSQACVIPKAAEKSEVPQHCIVVAVVPYDGKS